jgi:hypothetical protein
MLPRSKSAQANKSMVYKPSDMAHLSDILALYFEQLRTHFRNSVHRGGQVTDPTTGSSQLTGTGNTTWNIDTTELMAAVDGVTVELALTADTAIHSGSFLTGLADGSSCIAAVVLKNVAGTITMVTVKGTPAVTGTQVPPTDAEIQTAVGAGNEWIKLAHSTINRTGDTTVTESQDNTFRPMLAINIDDTFGDF